jgi:putative CRISPR-associated protein (TIGR02619 family)
LICNVGGSLLKGSLSRLPQTTSRKPDNWRQIYETYQANNWEGLAGALLKVDPGHKICGAEINTIEQIRNYTGVCLENLIFLVSDTPLGKSTGQVLDRYFQNRDLDLKTVEYHVVKHLQAERPRDFKLYGLRNLVMEITRHLQHFKGPDHAALNATGGYKAQSAMTAVIGQVLKMPVFYKQEHSFEIIEFPPLPICLDHVIMSRTAPFLLDFEHGKAVTAQELDHLDDSLRMLLVEVKFNGETLYELNPMGQICLAAFRFRNPNPTPKTKPEKNFE